MRDYESKISGPVSFSPTDHMGTSAVVPFGVKGGKFIVLGGPLKPAR